MAGGEYFGNVIVGPPKKADKDILMLISPSRLSQKAGREQVLPGEFVECGGKRSATSLWIVSDKLSVCRSFS
jgi:hypothetical protein